jgi:hypothetical protein
MQRQRADGEAQRLFPGCGAPRSGATLIRGPACCLKQPGSRVCSAPFPALHAAPRPGHGRRNLFKYHLDLCPMLIYPYSCPPHMRGCEPVAPARGERVGVRGRVRAGTQRSGGAGAPPGGTRTPRREPADGAKPSVLPGQKGFSVPKRAERPGRPGRPIAAGSVARLPRKRRTARREAPRAQQ